MELRVCSQCRKVRPGSTACPECGGALSLSDPTFLVGQTFGKYLLEGILGVGGMGVVYRATHSTLKRPAALKIVLPQAADESFQRRFLQEAQVLASLKHPNIVEVYDFDVSPWGTPYYVMEYLQGRTLRSVINEFGTNLSLADYAPVLADVGAALHFAHKLGVVHRDLKPENIFTVTYEERTLAKILDFGIAKLLKPGEEASNLTTEGTLLGTPWYLAPEQILGQPVGPFTDQYALALIVAEILTGKPVREGKSLGRILSEDIRGALPVDRLPLSDLPPALRSALQRATEPDGAARFPDVRDFLAALGLSPRDPAARSFDSSIPTLNPEATLATPVRVNLPSGQPSIPPSLQPTKVSGPMAAPELRAEAARTPRRRILTWVAGVAALVAVVLLGALLWNRRAPPGLEKAAPPQPAAGSLLERLREIPLPADATEVLGQQEGSYILRGTGCVYLLPGSGGAAARIPEERSRTALGATCDGLVFQREGGKIVLRDLSENLTFPWADRLPPGENPRLSPDGTVLAVERKGAIHLFRLTKGMADPLFQAPIPAGPAKCISLGDRYLAIFSGGSLRVWYLREKGRTWVLPLSEIAVNAIAIQDQAGLLAVGGWFDRIYVFDLAAGRQVASIPRSGQTRALCFLPDYPTLVAGGVGGLSLWRPGSGVAASWGTAENDVRSVRFTGNALVALDGGRRSLEIFAYRGMGLDPGVQVSRREIWAMAADAEESTLYLGGFDGNLYACDLRSGKRTARALHTQGITGLVLSGDHLATSSDDKTIALWKIPAMAVERQSRAHDFLINQLFLAGDPATLWSTSSDGLLKKWAWPSLEERESVDVNGLAGTHMALASLWVSPGGDTLVVGTWEDRLLVLRRSSAGWDLRNHPVPSHSLYSQVHLSAVSANLLVGTERRYGSYLYDLLQGRLHPLENLNFMGIWAVGDPSGNEAWVLGRGGILHYTFSRTGSGDLAYTLGASCDTDLGTLVTGTLLPRDGRLAVGGQSGQLHLVPLGSLKRPPLARGILP